MAANPSFRSTSDTAEITTTEDGSPALCSLELRPLSEKTVAPSKISRSSFTQYFNTSYAPSDEEIMILRQSLGEYEKKLDISSRKILELQHALSLEVAQREAFSQAIEEHRALLAPIRRVPVDVLQEIFYTITADSDASSPSSDLSPRNPSLIISQVCRRWRDVALASPHLWTTLGIRCPRLEPTPHYLPTWTSKMSSLIELVKLWTARSGQCPISLNIENEEDQVRKEDNRTITSSNYWYGLLTAALQQSSLRWTNVSLSLGVSWTSRPLLEFLRMTPERLPVLETLSMVVCLGLELVESRIGRELFKVQQASSLFCAVSLRSLRVGGCWTGLSRIDGLPALTSLDLDAWDPQTDTTLNGTKFLEIMKACSSLVQVTLCGDLLEPAAIVPLSDPVVMPVLATMNLNWSPIEVGFAPSLATPILQHLSLLYDPDVTTECSEVGTLECIRHFGSTLTSLTFSHTAVSTNVLSSILDSLPVLEVLDLTPAARRETEEYDPSDYGSDGFILSELSGGMTDSLRCPKLRIFKMAAQDIYPSGMLLGELTMEFLQKRLEAAESGEAVYLEEVDIILYCPTEGDRMDFVEELENRGLYWDNLKLTLRYR
ncbi:hypothetical protein NMY22_g12054 [Coprinellus aureogranulatus]|nr:hypothetical protein NMY22_g12054 [Coprinellus aureogranulatus]